MGEHTEADAARWRWLLEHAHIAMGEDGDLYLAAWLGDGIDALAWRDYFPWMSPRQRATLCGTSGGDDSGLVDDPESIDAAADHARGTP
jgi:hypothetical protein